MRCRDSKGGRCEATLAGAMGGEFHALQEHMHTCATSHLRLARPAHLGNDDVRGKPVGRQFLCSPIQVCRHLSTFTCARLSRDQPDWGARAGVCVSIFDSVRRQEAAAGGTVKFQQRCCIARHGVPHRRGKNTMRRAGAEPMMSSISAALESSATPAAGHPAHDRECLSAQIRCHAPCPHCRPPRAVDSYASPTPDLFSRALPPRLRPAARPGRLGGGAS